MRKPADDRQLSGDVAAHFQFVAADPHLAGLNAEERVGGIRGEDVLLRDLEHGSRQQQPIADRLILDAGFPALAGCGLERLTIPPARVSPKTGWNEVE